ncbi:hypothetical protein SAMN05216474_2661 [Lishizhenia tianjinensis]|uniref:Lipoprotein n=1 Tax=Lishizhenia tianjinensis TaxID=477690 RepID=A0A1I7BC11_9FLAO|nr:hypothetical protein [Lishizhenia tianjinensis]SFT84684.1 hypothetical protein SAMN05216474_2661 [Lishizhenia tianjinensis]
MKNLVHNVLLYSSLLILTTGCIKKSNKETRVHFHLFNPVTLEEFEGVQVKIYRMKSYILPKESKMELVWEGYTDASGRASYVFNAADKAKYEYIPEVDLSFTEGKELIFEPSPYYAISKDLENILNYCVVQKIQWIHHFKNINCFDANDKVRWRFKDLTLGSDNTWSYWFPHSGSNSFSPSGYFEGCTDHLTATRVDNQRIFLSQLEVTKNDSTYIIEDTLRLTGENGIDTLKLYY